MATIRKRGKNTYQFTVSIGRTADGKYKRKYKTYKVTTKMTEKQLKLHLQHEAYKFEQKVLSNSFISPKAMTFEEFSYEWKTKWLKREVSKNTFYLRSDSIKNHILPKIGHIKINEINTLMILDLMENLSRKDRKIKELSISSKQEIYKALMSVFKRAVEWNVIENNPMKKIKMPTEKKENKTLQVYTENEIKIIKDALKNETLHWNIFVNLAIATGMRRGELLALEWHHIDLHNMLINIEQALTLSGNTVEIKQPKFNSKRIISIPPSLVKTLKNYKEISKENKSILKIDNNKNWVFFNNKGHHFHPSYATTWWTRFLKRLNKKLQKEERKLIKVIRLHDLRHTSATILISNNIHPKVISERIGHKKTSTTMDLYGQALPAADKVASDKLNQLFDNDA